MELWEQESRENYQRVVYQRRFEFWHLYRPTQQAIVDILTTAEQTLHDQSVSDAQNYIQHAISAHMDKHHRFITDRDGVDWNEVHEQIVNGGCFSNTDMGGLELVARRVGQELTVFRSLMDLPEPPLEDYF
jgi:hypothetical protein